MGPRSAASPRIDQVAIDAMCRRSPAFFASEKLLGDSGPPFNGRFLIARHHEEWSELVTTYDRLCVEAARGHGKSHFYTLAVPLWDAYRSMKAGLDPPDCVIFSASQRQAQRLLLKIKTQVETNPRLASLLPPEDLRTQWSAQGLRLANGYTIVASGYGTKVRGGHPRLIIVDDGFNDNTAYSENVRLKEIEYFFQAIRPMLIPGGKIIVVGCVTPDTWVNTGQGLRQIGALCPGPLIPQTLYDLDIDVLGRRGRAQTAKFWVNGTCATRKVELDRGYGLEGSFRHPVLVMAADGEAIWRRLDALQLGDFVALRRGDGLGTDARPPDLRDFKIRHRARAARCNAMQLPDAVTPDLAYLLGLWTAEGSFEPSGRVAITNTEAPIRQWLQAAPFGLRFQPNPSAPWTLRCASKDFLELVTHLGGKLAKAPGKCVPASIMGADEVTVAAFLRGYADGDGSAYKGGAVEQVTFATTSGELAQQLQILLLALGIVTTRSQAAAPCKTKRAPGAQHRLWTVRAVQSDARRYMMRVGFGLCRKQDAITGAPVEDNQSIPGQAASLHRLRRAKPDGRKRGRHRRGGLGRPGNLTMLRQARTHRRSTLLSLRDWYAAWGVNDYALDAVLAEPDLVWLKVKSVTTSSAFTVDFVVPGDHSFVSNGIVSHNTPLHRQDLYARLSKNKQYEFRRYPAILEVGEFAGQPLWPELFPMAELRAIEEEIKSIRFTREYLCCAAGTFIETQTGPKAIQDVSVGEVVLTHRGRWRRVTEVMQRRYEGEVRRLKGTLRLTPEHPVLTQDGFVPASTVGSGDLVTFPVPETVSTAPTTLSLVADTAIAYLCTSDGTRVYARGSATHIPIGTIGRSGAKSVPHTVPITPELMYLFGLWLAEGFVGTDDRIATFCFGLHEAETLAADASRILATVFGVTPRIVTKVRGPGGTGGSAVVVVSSRLLANWLARLFGRGAAGKSLPLVFRDLAPELLWQLVLGYADGDGWVASGHAARISSVSQRLLQDVRFCLARCGLFSTLTLQDKGGAGVICGRAVQQRPSWRLTLSGGAAAALFARELPARAHSWGSVHMPKTERYEGTVHNLEVEEDHSYVADGVAVHNCQPITDGSSLFPRRLFEGVETEQPKLSLGMPLVTWQRLGVNFVAIGVDFGLSSSVDSDYTVIWTMGGDAQGNRWIMDIYRERGLSYTEQKQLIVHAAQRYKADLVFVESNQAQRIFGDELQRLTDLPICKVNTGENKHSQVRGLPALRVLLENRKYRLPLGDERSQTLIAAWIDEMQGVTVQSGKVVSVAEHDDLPMANWICEQAFAEATFGFSFGDQPGDAEALAELLSDVAATGNPEHEDYLPDDSFVTGALPPGRGRPATVNARLVEGAEDVLRETDPVVTPNGYPFGAPTAAQLRGGGGW